MASKEGRPAAGGQLLPPSGPAEKGVVGAPVTRPGLWARLRALADAHPRLFTWLVLAVGMVAILLWASRSEPLLLHQRLVLVVATIALAGLCAWIIHWE
jgi:hypothetical protein